MYVTHVPKSCNILMKSTKNLAFRLTVWRSLYYSLKGGEKKIIWTRL